MKRVSFTAMADGTKEEYELIAKLEHEYEQGMVDRVLDSLKALRGVQPGYQVDRYEHSLQTATRALRDAADEEMIVCALLHDIGDNLAPHKHAAFAAEVLRPYVTHERYWLVDKHGIIMISTATSGRSTVTTHVSRRRSGSANAGTRPPSTRNTTPSCSNSSSRWCVAFSRASPGRTPATRAAATEAECC